MLIIKRISYFLNLLIYAKSVHTVVLDMLSCYYNLILSTQHVSTMRCGPMQSVLSYFLFCCLFRNAKQKNK